MLLLLAGLKIIGQHTCQHPSDEGEAGGLEGQDIARLYHEKQDKHHQGGTEPDDEHIITQFLFLFVLGRAAGWGEEIRAFFPRIECIHGKEYQGKPQAEPVAAGEVGQQGAHGEGDEGAVDGVFFAGHGDIISLGGRCDEASGSYRARVLVRAVLKEIR